MLRPGTGPFSLKRDHQSKRYPWMVAAAVIGQEDELEIKERGRQSEAATQQA
jgi:hypothetical protein